MHPRIVVLRTGVVSYLKNAPPGSLTRSKLPWTGTSPVERLRQSNYLGRLGTPLFDIDLTVADRRTQGRKPVHLYEWEPSYGAWCSSA